MFALPVLSRARLWLASSVRRPAAAGSTARIHPPLVVCSSAAHRSHSHLCRHRSMSLLADPPKRVGLTGAAGSDALSELDWKVLRSLHQLKNDLPERPKQTGFRVFAILLYKPLPVGQAQAASDFAISTPHPYDVHNYVEGTDQQLAYLTGTNTEPCSIGSSICAERSAVLQMRMKNYSEITKLFITADSDTIITPGLLCRELLCEFLALDTPIVLASKNDTLPGGFDVQVASLGELFPFPSIYLNVPGSTVQQFAHTFHDTTANKFTTEFADKPQWIELYQQTVVATQKDTRPSLHPLRYAAGVLWSDGTIRCVAMTKLLEYGWSLDPVVKLVSYLEENRTVGILPEVILVADQFGNLHSPSSPGRSHLFEGGHDPILIFHDRTGRLVQARARHLALDCPDAIEDVLPSTVTQSLASAKTAQ